MFHGQVVTPQGTARLDDNSRCALFVVGGGGGAGEQQGLLSGQESHCRGLQARAPHMLSTALRGCRQAVRLPEQAGDCTDGCLASACAGGWPRCCTRCARRPAGPAAALPGAGAQRWAPAHPDLEGTQHVATRNVGPCTQHAQTFSFGSAFRQTVEAVFASCTALMASVMLTHCVCAEFVNTYKIFHSASSPLRARAGALRPEPPAQTYCKYCHRSKGHSQLGLTHCLHIVNTYSLCYYFLCLFPYSGQESVEVGRREVILGSKQPWGCNQTPPGLRMPPEA